MKSNIKLLVKRSFNQTKSCHGQLDVTLSRAVWDLQYNGDCPAATDSFIFNSGVISSVGMTKIKVITLNNGKT